MLSALQENGIVQINGKSFLYPNELLLLKPRDVREDFFCKVGDEEKQEESQCVQVLDGKEGDELEIALVNEGKKMKQEYEFYILYILNN